MKKTFTFLFGLLVGVTISLLLYEYGFKIIADRFQEYFLTYIIMSIIIIAILIIVYFIGDRWFRKIESNLSRNVKVDFKEVIIEKKWDAINPAIDELLTKIQIGISKWSLVNWIFRTIQIIILGFVGIFGSILLLNQNELIKKQNYRLAQQTYLQEAERRSSLVFLMSNIFDKMDIELKHESNTDRKLSDELIGQIASLSISFKPYRYLRGDSLIVNSLSPERGQLLLTLVNSKLNVGTLHSIYYQGNFKYTDLSNTTITQPHFQAIDMSNSSFENTKLVNTTFYETTLINCNFENAKIVGNSSIGGSDISGSKFINTEMSNRILGDMISIENINVEDKKWLDNFFLKGDSNNDLNRDDFEMVLQGDGTYKIINNKE